MTILIATLIVMLLVAVGLSVGVMAGRKPITGSCGGVGKALGDPNYVCELCGGDEAKCAELKTAPNDVEKNTKSNLAYDVSKNTDKQEI
jgi:uncharacterized protein